MKRYIIASIDPAQDRKIRKAIEEIRVNGPYARGERMPDFNKYSINESAFADGLRFKSYEITYENGGIVIDWRSQEPVTESEAREGFNEFCRAITEVINWKCGTFEGTLRVLALISDREGVNEYSFDTELTF